MKKSLIILIAISLVAILAMSCVSAGNVLSGALSGALSTAPASSGGLATAGTSAATIDFQPNDIICSTGAGSKMETAYAVGRVLTPASPATKNQAEVLFVSDGSKLWVNYVINSRKATKADMQVGAPVFYNTYVRERAETDIDSYRKGSWYLGYITSTDELFKGLVEIAGNNYTVDFLRIPTDPVK